MSEPSELPLMILEPLEGAHSPDSTRTRADCGHTCWISPGALATRAAIDVQAVCLSCVDLDELDDADVRVTPVMYESLVQSVGKEEADRAIVKFSEPGGLKRHLEGDNIP